MFVIPSSELRRMKDMDVFVVTVVAASFDSGRSMNQFHCAVLPVCLLSVCLFGVFGESHGPVPLIEQVEVPGVHCTGLILIAIIARRRKPQ